jgi:anti-anti-sigma factor
MRLGRTKIVLNFEKTTFLTTRGIAECAAAAKRLRDRGGDLKIANARGDVWRVIEMVWLHRMITCYPGVNEAVREF